MPLLRSLARTPPMAPINMALLTELGQQDFALRRLTTILSCTPNPLQYFALAFAAAICSDRAHSPFRLVESVQPFQSVRGAQHGNIYESSRMESGDGAGYPGLAWA